MLDSHLIHSCTIQRATKTEDAYGNAVETWHAVEAEVLCRLVDKLTNVLINQGTEKAILSTYQLLVPNDTDLQPRDRITRITLEDGTMLERVFLVETLSTRRGKVVRHKSARLSEVL